MCPLLYTNTNNYIIPYLGHIQLNKLNNATVQVFYNELLKQNLKPNTIKKIIEVLRGCYKYAKKVNLVNTIPTDIETVKEEKVQTVVWDEEEFKFFLSEVKDTWLYLPTLIIGFTGLRIGELCGLRWSNINLKEGIIHVKEQTLNDKENHSLVHTNILKTNSASRSISIPRNLVHILTVHKETQNNTSEFVICDDRDNMCNPRNVSVRFTKKVAKYKNNELRNLPQISIHGLRHTHATMLLLKGENIKVISERLGHTSIKITLDTYSHVLPSMRQKTADLLDSMFTDL